MNEKTAASKKAEAVASYLSVLAMVGFMAYVSARVQRSASSPDFGKLMRMRVLQGAKRTAQWQATMWQNIATDLATAYNRAK